jgi:hypothetical protein
MGFKPLNLHHSPTLIKPQKGAKFTKTENDIQQNQVVTNKKNPERDFLRDHQP